MTEKPDDGTAKAGEAAGIPEKSSEKQPAEEVDDVPDPDEDDLDDLDDMLDEFSNVKLGPKPVTQTTGREEPAAVAASDPAPDPQASVEDMLNDEEFAKQLQAGMADLLGELEKSPEMQAEFENIFKQIGAAAEAEGASSTKPDSSKAAEDVSFQETIRRTMERMQTSGDQATAAATAEGSDDFLAEMLKQIQSGSLDGAGGEEEFSKMLVGMMEQLTAKEILYEPMKELNDKFPDWMSKNKDKVPKEDLKRYEEQQILVKQIVDKFEEPTFSDSNPKDREQIVDLMQKMQAAGSPPADLVGDMASAQEAFNTDESCNPQ